MTRETVEGMIAAALDRASLNPRTAVDSEAEQALLVQYQKKIAVLENERDETFKKIANLEGQRDGAFAATEILSREKDEAIEKIAALEKQRDEDHATIQALDEGLEEALHKVTLAEDKVIAASWDGAKLRHKQQDLDDMRAFMESREAKVTHLESQLAKIHSLSKSDETVDSTSLRPGVPAAWGSHENLPQASGWGDLTASNSVDGAADVW